MANWKNLILRRCIPQKSYVHGLFDVSISLIPAKVPANMPAAYHNHLYLHFVISCYKIIVCPSPAAPSVLARRHPAVLFKRPRKMLAGGIAKLFGYLAYTF